MRDQLAAFLRRRGDLVLAAALTALALFESAIRDAPIGDQLKALVITLALGAAAAIRSRQPLPLLGLMLPVGVVWATGHGDRGGMLDVFALFALLGVYSTAAHTTGRQTLLAAGIVLGLDASNVLESVIEGRYLLGEIVAFDALIYGLPWITGRTVRHRRLNDRRLAEEQARAAAAVVGERAQIARELHDVVAHSISVIVLQARGGR